ncbi:MAG: glycosyl hydrolase family 17 protein [Opitutales bacterium]
MTFSPVPVRLTGVRAHALFRRILPALLLASCAVTAGAALEARRPVSFMMGAEWIGEGVAFSPYRDGQGPEAGMAAPSDAEVEADLRLAGQYWKILNVYDSSTVTEQVLRLIRDHHLPLKVMLGAWLTTEKSATERAANHREIMNAIRLANAYPEQVFAVSVGNEACVWWSDHRMEPAAMIGFIREVRSAVRQPVTTADDFDFWNKPESRAVAAEVDFINLHAYALWRGEPVEHATEWLDRTYHETVQFHPGLTVVIGETGWTTRHDLRRTQPGQEGALIKGETSEAAQLTFLRGYYRWVRERKIPAVLFEAFDENWKGGGGKVSPDAAEKHFGVFDAQRKPKSSFTAIMREFYAVNP